MNARARHINEIENIVKSSSMFEHTLENFNDGLTMMLIENRLQLNEGWLGDAWDGISGAFHTTMDIVQGAAAAISLASYSSVVGAPIGLVASIVDAAIDVGYAVGHTIDAGVKYAKGDKEAGWEALKDAGGRAAWAAVGLIPIVGDVGTMARVGGKTAKVINASADAAKVFDALDAGKDLTKLVKTGDLSKDMVKLVKSGDITKDMLKTGFGTIKQIDDISKGALKSADAFSDVMKNTKTISNVSDVTMTGNRLTKFGANVIDKIGNSKFLGKVSFGATGKLASYSDNFKLANASFATLSDGGKLADFATGGTKLWEPTSKLGSKMFGHGLWGGGKMTSLAQKTLMDPAALGKVSMSTLDKLKSPIRYTRSMLFNSGDLSANIGKSSNLMAASEDVLHSSSKYVFNRNSKSLLDFTSKFKFDKIANNKLLRTANKFNKWNKVPQISQAWQGGIDIYDKTKNKIGSDRRQLMQLGPDFKLTPFSKKIDLSGPVANLSGITWDYGPDTVDADGNIVKGKPQMRFTGEKEEWKPGIIDDPTINYETEPEYQELPTYDWMDDQDADAMDQSTKSATTKQKVDAETELKRQQQKVKNL